MNINIPLSVIAPPAAHTFEEHLIVRFPPALAGRIRAELAENNQPGDLSILFTDKRHARLKYDSRTYAAVLVDLPTHLETYKTLDRSQYTKTADVHQLLLVLDPSDPDLVARLEADGCQWPHGLTPPMRDVRERRFAGNQRSRETAQAMEDIERTVQRLIEADETAESSKFVLYDASSRVLLTGGTGIDTAKEQEPDGKASLDEGDEEFADFAAEIEFNMIGDVAPAAAEEESPQPAVSGPPPAVQQLQKQLEEKQRQLALVTNPLIRARIEEIIKQLTNDINSRL